MNSFRFKLLPQFLHGVPFLIALPVASILSAQTAADLTPAALAGKTVTCTIVGGNTPFETSGSFAVQLGTPAAGQYSIAVSSGNTIARTGTYTTTSGADVINIRLNGYLVNNSTVELELYPIGSAIATSMSGAGRTYFEMFGGPANKRGSFTIGGVTPGGGTTTTTIPVISLGSQLFATVGVPFSYQIVTVTGTSPATSYSTAGGDAAYSINATTGLITRTFAAVGTFPLSFNATNSAGTSPTTSITVIVSAATPTAAAVSFLSNLSVRARAGSGSETLIVGVTVGGSTTSTAKSVLVRGVGPTLTTFGVTGVLADPVLTVLSGSTPIATNDDWGSDANVATTSAAVGAFALPAGSRDSALFGTGLGSGGYTVQLTGKDGATGNALVELYDTAAATNVTANTTRFTNVSARTFGGTGSDTLIVGFNVAGTGTRRLVIRAVGPGLVGFGVTGTMADPKLELYNGQTKVGENDNWDATTLAAQQSVGAFALTNGSRDAVLVSTLSPGGYTVQVTGGTIGVTLVEVYEAP